MPNRYPWDKYKEMKEDVSPDPLPPVPEKREEPVIPKPKPKAPSPWPPSPSTPPPSSPPSQPPPPASSPPPGPPVVDRSSPEEKFEDFASSRPVVEEQLRAVDKPPEPRPDEKKEEYESRVMEHYRTKYREHGYIPYKVREQIRENVPGVVKDMGLYPHYTRAVYEQSLGVDEGAKKVFEHKFRTEYEKRQTLSWAKKNLVFKDPDTGEDVSWSELKRKESALYLKKTSRGFEVVYDPVRWQREEDKRHEGDLGYHIVKGIGSVFSPERATIASEQLFGTGEVTSQEGMVTYYGKRKERYLAESQYRYHKLAEEGDTLGIVLRGISSPVGSTFVAMGLGAGFGFFSQTSIGSAQLATVRGVAVTPSTAVGIGAGSYFVGSTALKLKDVYDKQGMQGLRNSIRDMGVTLPFQFMGFKAGHQAGVSSYPKFKNVYSGMDEAYRSKVVSRLPGKSFVDKQVWMYKAKNPANAFMFKERLGFNVRRWFPKYPMVRQKIGSNIVLKSMSKYKIKLGYRPSELRNIYRGPKMWKRPEAIAIMPKEIVKTETFVFHTPKHGIKFVTKAVDNSYVSYGTLKPIGKNIGARVLRGSTKGGGKIVDVSPSIGKDVKFMVSGKSYYKYYTSPFEGARQSLGTRLYYGIISSKDVMSGHTDFTVTRSTGSFFSSSQPFTKALTVYKPRPFSFGGRLFNESFYSESISYSKQFGGSISIPGKYGLQTIETPDFTFSKTFGVVDGFKKFRDVSISRIVKPDFKNIRLSDSFTSGEKVTISKQDLFTPGGLGIKIEGKPSISMLKTIPSLYPKTSFRIPSGWALATGGVSIGFLEFLEEGVGGSRDYWKGRSPKIKEGNLLEPVKTPVVKPVSIVSTKQKLGTKNLLQPVQNIMSRVDTRSLTKTSQSQITSSSNLTRTQLKQSSQLKSATLMKTIQLTKTVTPLVVVPPVYPNININEQISYPPSSPKVPKIPVMPKGEEDLLLGEKDKNVYNVLVKDRYIVRGKKKYQEKFIKVNKKPLSRRDALRLGGTVVDRSASRSFKITPTSGKPGRPSINTGFWPMLSYKFRGGKKGKPFVERTSFAIDSPGEINEISARGWLAQQRRMTPKRMDVIDKKDIRNIVRGGRLF